MQKLKDAEFQLEVFNEVLEQSAEWPPKWSKALGKIGKLLEKRVEAAKNEHAE